MYRLAKQIELNGFGNRVKSGKVYNRVKNGKNIGKSPFGMMISGKKNTPLGKAGLS